MKKIILISLFIILLSFLVVAQEEHDITEAKQIIDSEISCNNLSDAQLESIGDYYMEQMHSGEAHEYMDGMMGGEGSESLKQVHINIAKRVYCNENVGGMMGMMVGESMMGSFGTSSTGEFSWGFGWIFMVLVIIVLVLLIIWLIKQIQTPKREMKRRK